MNRFLYKMEQKYGKYAIHNLPLMLIMCYVVGYLINLINPAFLNYITLNPERILHGQIWRLLSWIVVPPSSLSIWVIIMLFFYYSIAKQLEMIWGTFYFNVYFLSGILFNIVGAFLTYGIGMVAYGPEMAQIIGVVLGGMISTYYINMTLFLAYATTFPEHQVYLYFFIPIKMKYMGIVYAVFIAIDVILTFTSSVPFLVALIKLAVILFAMLNFIVFFFGTRSSIHLNKAQRTTRANFRKATGTGFGSGFHTSTAGGASGSNPHMRSSSKNNEITRHKCAICGQTEVTAPNMSFRFCSKCNGNYEYCENHLFTHTHVK